jgi:hypothetical protein
MASLVRRRDMSGDARALGPEDLTRLVAGRVNAGRAAIDAVVRAIGCPAIR